MSESDAALTALYTDSMRLCGQAYDAGHYDASYHLLAAAMHCAADLLDPALLADVSRLASEQIGRIDQAAPGYHHSTASAKKRGNPSMLATLATLAQSRAVMLRHNAR